MRRVRYHAHGGPEVLAIEEADIPEPGPGQVLIRTEAIGVNFVDVKLRRETSPDSLLYRSLPATLSGDVVGTVEAVGPDGDAALAGTRVVTLLEDAYADYVLADAGELTSVPADLDAGVASMVPTVGAVALGALHTGRLGKGETVLVTAGAGAIGHLAVQLAKRRGAGTVIATASKTKLDFLKEIGADVAIDYTEPGWTEQVRAAAPGGVDVVLEGVGGEVLQECIGLLAPHGRAVAFGAAAGVPPNLPVRSLYALKTVTGFSVMAWRAADAEQFHADIAELTSLFLTGGLRAVADTRLPLNEVAQAHRLLEERAVRGRLILIP